MEAVTEKTKTAKTEDHSLFAKRQTAEITQMIEAAVKINSFDGTIKFRFFNSLTENKNNALAEVTSGNSDGLWGYTNLLVYLNGVLFLDADGTQITSPHNIFSPLSPLKKNTLPTISLSCLTRLISDIKPNKMVSFANKTTALLFSKVDVIEHTTNDFKKLKVDSTLVKNYKKHRKGYKHTYRENGYTVVYNHSVKSYFAHRPSQVLLVANDKYYLIGTDDGTYFGCELPSYAKPKLIEEAYECLIPNEFRGAKGLKRQGEWFVLESDPPKDFNKLDYCSLYYMMLPKSSVHSNDHAIEHDNGNATVISLSRDEMVLHSGNGCNLVTSDHPDLYLSKNKIYTIRRNTAVRSVSEEGVD